MFLKSLVFLIVFLVKLEAAPNPLYFTIDHHQRCLYEEVTKNTLFKIEFMLVDQMPSETLQDPASINTHGARVVIFSPKDKAVLYKLALPQQLGKLSFFSEENGEYRICFEMSAAVNKKLRFKINLNIGDSDFNEEKKQVENSIVSTLIEKVKKFIHQAKQFRKVQKMNQNSEHVIFNDTEGISFKIVVATVAQTLVIIAAGVFQMFTLRRFLIKRRLY